MRTLYIFDIDKTLLRGWMSRQLWKNLDVEKDYEYLRQAPKKRTFKSLKSRTQKYSRHVYLLSGGHFNKSVHRWLTDEGIDIKPTNIYTMWGLYTHKERLSDAVRHEKARIVSQLLRRGKYRRLKAWDDSKRNLNAFRRLAEASGVKFKPVHIKLAKDE